MNLNDWRDDAREEYLKKKLEDKLCPFFDEYVFKEKFPNILCDLDVDDVSYYCYDGHYKECKKYNNFLNKLIEEEEAGKQ